MKKRQKKKPSRFLFLSIIGLLAFLQYANTLDHEYAWDDEIVITKNVHTQKGLAAMADIWTKAVYVSKRKIYRPVTQTTFALEVQLFGNNPQISHLVNVLLYVGCCILLFITLRLFLFDRPPIYAFLITLLFVVHPVHTEVVANIKGRDEILALIFSLGSACLFLKFLERKKIKYILIGSILLILACLSKINAITMLAVFPMFYLYRFGDKMSSRVRTPVEKAKQQVKSRGQQIKETVSGISQFFRRQLIDRPAKTVAGERDSLRKAWSGPHFSFAELGRLTKVFGIISLFGSLLLTIVFHQTLGALLLTFLGMGLLLSSSFSKEWKVGLVVGCALIGLFFFFKLDQALLFLSSFYGFYILAQVKGNKLAYIIGGGLAFIIVLYLIDPSGNLIYMLPSFLVLAALFHQNKKWIYYSFLLLPTFFALFFGDPFSLITVVLLGHYIFPLLKSGSKKGPLVFLSLMIPLATVSNLIVKIPSSPSQDLYNYLSQQKQESSDQPVQLPENDAEPITPIAPQQSIDKTNEASQTKISEEELALAIKGETAISALNNSLFIISSNADKYATIAVVQLKYLGKLFFPHPLVHQYGIASIPASDWKDWKAWLSVLIHLFLLGFALKRILKRDPIAFGILFYLITLSIYSNIVRLGPDTMAERFLFFPSVGFCIALVFLLAKLLKPNFSKTVFSSRNNQLFLSICLIILMAHFYKTYLRNKDWKNNTVLTENTLPYAPNNAFLHASSANIWMQKDKKSLSPAEGRIAHKNIVDGFKKAVEVYPEYYNAWGSLGLYYVNEGKFKEATACFEQAARIRPGDPFPSYYLGLAYFNQNNYKKTIEAWELCLTQNGQLAGYTILDKATLQKIFYFLGKSYELTGQPQKAQLYYSKVQ